MVGFMCPRLLQTRVSWGHTFGSGMHELIAEAMQGETQGRADQPHGPHYALHKAAPDGEGRKDVAGALHGDSIAGDEGDEVDTLCHLLQEGQRHCSLTSGGPEQGISEGAGTATG